MRRLICSLLLLLAVVQAWPAAARQTASDEAIKSEALRGFEEILDLWREGNYPALFERTIGKDTREAFARRLQNAPLKPACCWEKMQGATAAVKSATAVTVKATLGFDGPGNTEYKTKSFKLLKDGDVWQVNRTELLTLAEARKGKRRSAGIHR
jgi:hypothetical protein